MAKKPKENDWKDRLNVVYSTNPDFKYELDDEEEQTTLQPSQQRLRVQLDRKNRGGKVVTLVTGFIGTEDDLKEMTKLYQESTGIGSICMLRRLTYTGIEASNISFKSWIDGSDEAIMAITKIGYGTLLSHDFVADPDVAKLFQKKSAEIYKSIVNNE